MDIAQVEPKYRELRTEFDAGAIIAAPDPDLSQRQCSVCVMRSRLRKG